VNLSLATRDTNVSFRQQVTFGSARSKGSTQSEADIRRQQVTGRSWPSRVVVIVAALPAFAAIPIGPDSRSEHFNLL
jgi:hypothetical protein